MFRDRDTLDPSGNGNTRRRRGRALAFATALAVGAACSSSSSKPTPNASPSTIPEAKSTTPIELNLPPPEVASKANYISQELYNKAHPNGVAVLGILNGSV